MSPKARVNFFPDFFMMSLLERLFQLRQRGTNVRTEVLGGVTTFAAMAYIIVANPAILAAAGIPLGPSTIATILTAVIGSLLMGLYANRPIAVAPYMGENAFIAYGLAALAIGWQERLGAVFVSGLAFLLITLLGVRTWLAASISASMKHSFAVGIGLFLAFIGLTETGIIDKPPEPGSPPVRLGQLHEPRVLLAVGGLIVMIALMCWRVRGAILLGMAATATVSYALNLGLAPSGLVAVPAFDEYLNVLAFKLDISGVLRLSVLPVLLTLFLMSFLDTLGTLVGVGAAGDMLDKAGNLPQIERPMLVDALACMFSAVAGTSTSGAYIESATGIRDGTRTGLAAVTTGVLFALSLFCMPLIQPLQHLKYVYGPALIAVGVLMFGWVTKIRFDDLTEAAPAFATIVMMVFTYNIGNGLTAGLLIYPVIKVLAGRWRDLNAGSVIWGLVCLVYYVFGMLH
jgi:AGZA family xanthine/uracil permease-like MFS transporter